MHDLSRLALPWLPFEARDNPPPGAGWAPKPALAERRDGADPVAARLQRLLGAGQPHFPPGHTERSGSPAELYLQRWQVA